MFRSSSIYIDVRHKGGFGLYWWAGMCESYFPVLVTLVATNVRVCKHRPSSLHSPAATAGPARLPLLTAWTLAQHASRLGIFEQRTETPFISFAQTVLHVNILYILST